MSVMQTKQRLVTVIQHPGFKDVLALAEESLKELERQVIDEEDDGKATGLRRDAKGARKFWSGFLTRLNAASRVTEEPGADDWLEICN